MKKSGDTVGELHAPSDQSMYTNKSSITSTAFGIRVQTKPGNTHEEMRKTIPQRENEIRCSGEVIEHRFQNNVFCRQQLLLDTAEYKSSE